MAGVGAVTRTLLSCVPVARWLAMVATVAPLLTCTEGSPTQPGTDGAIDLQVVVTSTALPATAAVGTTVPPVSVQVLNKKNGQIIYNEPVSFVVTAGGGTVYAPTVQTDNMSGIAQDLWTLGTRAGFDTLQARVVDTSRVGPLSGSASVATFAIKALPLAASVISAQAGNGQTAVAGSMLPIAPAVLVTDRFANPIAGVTVTFAVASGGGSAAVPSQTTNASGIATVGSWTLGTTAGQNRLTASSAGLSGSPVSFTATGINAAANQVIPATSTALTGTVAGTIPAATGPAVRVVDQNNNGVPNVAVTFGVTGPTCPSCTPYPGTSSPAPAKIAGVASVTTLTDANGRASGGDWTLSTVAGANTLQATVVGLSGSPVTFTATGTAGAAALLFKKAGDGQSASVGAVVPLAVQVTDVYGNPGSSGIAVTFAVQSGGGSLGGVSSATVATDLSGTATVSWTLGSVAGTNTLAATALSKTVTFTATATGPAGLNISNLRGDAQTASAGSTLPVAPTVQVTDQSGHAVASVMVTFSVTTGGGSITAPRS
jgi:adhesin/invasin